MEFNGNKKFDVWQSDACNLITGGDGILFNRSLSQNRQDIHFFHKDLCRMIPLTYKTSVDVGCREGDIYFVSFC